LAFSMSLLINGIFLPGMKALLLGVTLVFLVGLIDDIKPLPALLKLILQVLISLLVILWGDIQFTFFYTSDWAPFVNIPLTVLWMVGLTNAMNFFDGIDGLAAAISMTTALFLGIIAFKTFQPALGWIAVALIGTCAGFMPYNFRFGSPALLFMGDAGSTFLGFTLAGLAVMGEWSTTSHFVSLSAPLLIFGIPIFDMIYVNLSRIKNRQAKNFLELLSCTNKIATMSACLGVSALIIMNQKALEALLGLFQALLILALIVLLMLKGRERIPAEGDRRTFRRRREDR
ncbi:MAG: undecaprenyl/decaprenyl-phosphate alpha-N-acetylglucosaminyl 1-phosphate transferase, partial [Deltaproteobacteria bacterium]|nr:undecaprenyl/decaprenyl-phosphate alpha-N-acetylglucosaminyl 1-phosphate transferase [Deltaproteobacteria bacterium]